MLGHTQTQIDHAGGWVDIFVAMVFIADVVVVQSEGLARAVTGSCMWQGERG